MRALLLPAAVLSLLLVAASARADDPPSGEVPAPEAPSSGDAPSGDAPQTPDAPEAPGTPEAPAPGTPEAPKKGKEAREARKAAKPPKGREAPLAPDTPEAQALDHLLAVDPKYTADGTVDLLYTFTEDEHTADWDRSGFDRADEVGNKRGLRRPAVRNQKPLFLALSVGSQSTGVLLHKLSLKDQFEVSFTLHIERSTSRSDLVFFVGDAGVRFGNQFAERKGSRFRPLSGKQPEGALADLSRGERATVKLEVEGDVLRAFVNGELVGETKRLAGKLDGRIGIYASDVVLLLHKVEIKGEIDKAKL